jgi:UDP-2,4-diacetamido-2,4,6-trideoxy-beta-L-altropyranose hydrolase
MRCLTLANELRVNGVYCEFICRVYPGNLIEFINQCGFKVNGILPYESLTIDAEHTKSAIEGELIDWLIVDHYSLDASWEKLLRPLCRKIMVIDDLANRPHDCDLLLDQNYYCDQDFRYQGLLPEHCVTLLGPSYVLLRPEFHLIKQKPKVRNGCIKRILVFFGGADLANHTGILLSALEHLSIENIWVDVVVGPSNPHAESIRETCNRLPYAHYLYNVSNMAELIANADIGVGAGGSSMWERCYLGLPTITVVFAKNQLRTTEDVAQLGAIEYIGWADRLESDDYARAISKLATNSIRVNQISNAALALVKSKANSSVLDEILK